jgi:NADPH:quinone reductase-like Zn-dependent oxidoreductase
LDLGVLLGKRGAVHATSLRSRPTEQKAEICAAVVEHVWPLYASGAIQTVTDRVLPLAEAATAHQLLAESGHFGKVLLAL